jgi:GT2 family glycosyltransferase
LVSILIPCAGQLEYTKLCVPSILKNSRDPFELIALDIGSLDGTSAYLAGIAAAARQRVEVVRTLTDLGLAELIEDALKLARGQYLVLLNNDTIVPSLWLTQLVALAQRIPEVGLIGPMSNYAAPPQVVERVPYRIRRRAADGLVDVSAVEEFADAARTISVTGATRPTASPRKPAPWARPATTATTRPARSPPTAATTGPTT